MTKSVRARDGLARGAATVISMYAGISGVGQRMSSIESGYSCEYEITYP